MARLANLSFTDAVLGLDYCDIKYEGPDVVQMVDVEGDLPEEIAALRAACQREFNPEFTLHYDTLRFRVTTMAQEDGPMWFLSRIDAQVRPVAELPVPRHFLEFTLRPRLQGLILVTGGFGAGKTTTASSLFCHRIACLGGTGVALEDPVGEVQMAGRHGDGRIIAIPVTRERGGYHAALQLVRRSRADYIMVGEIRDARTAIEVLDIANTDMPVIATMHASSIPEAFDKYQAYLRAEHASSSEANARLAMSVAAIIHITKEHVRGSEGKNTTRYIPRCLILDRTDPTCTGTFGKVRDGNFIGLNDDIASQASRRAHSFG